MNQAWIAEITSQVTPPPPPPKKNVKNYQSKLGSAPLLRHTEIAMISTVIIVKTEQFIRSR